MKVTYGVKLVFLTLSWVILFTGLDGDKINGQTFFASVLIYTGAIVFDLIFLCIDANARVGKLETGIYYISYGLAICNFLLTIVELIGALGGLNIILDKEKGMVIVVTQCSFTNVFPAFLSWKIQISFAMMSVLFIGLSSIVPGLLMTRLRRLNQVQS
ncbi:MAG: hypothetical protein IKJ39_05265 [Lachnospiraceae bacterium]|nr:hypothetical protein [Lachnospiraceae bacterium]MBR3824589.1 hypothetical protein [Lachnospiraceae bacterium]